MQKNSVSRSKRQNHPNELSGNRRRSVCWSARAENEGQLVELVGDQTPSLKHPRSKIGQEVREQMRCQDKSDCQKSNGEELVCKGY